MQTYNTDVTLDLSGQNNGAVVYAKQYDSNTRTITVTILQDGKPFDLNDITTARVEIRKPDGEQIFNDCSISDGNVIVEIPQQALIVSGIAELEISLMENNQLISSSVLKLVIEPSVLDDEAVKSSSEYLSFYNALMELQPAIENADEAVTAAEQAVKKAEEAVTNSENAIETSSSAAQNAQTQALAAETAANNANTAAQNAQTQADAANAAANRATSAAEQAEISDAAVINSRIDNLKIGTVNRLTNTQTPVMFNIGRYATNIVFNTNYGAAENLSGKSVIVSVDFHIQNFVASEESSKIALVATDNSIYSSFGGITVSENGTVHYQKQLNLPTFTNPDNFRIYIRADYCNIGMTATISNLKLEIGDYATDWSLAPEDSISAISKLNEQIETVPGHNFLDNSNFAIWQESTTYTKADDEALTRPTADRWENHATESGTITVKQGDGMTIQNNGSNYVVLRQVLDNCSFLYGKNVTLSFSLNGTVYNHTFENIPEGFLLKYKEGIWSVTSDTIDNIQISIKGNAVINWVKLELGTIPTQYIPPNYALELEKCKSYYCPLTIRRTPYCQHTEGENTISDFQIDFGRNMRTAPTITGTVSIRYQDGNSLITDTVPETYIIQNDHAVFQYLVPINTYITANLVLDARTF